MDAAPRDLTYIVHSGYGNQLQSLLAAVFVANVTGHRIAAPPLFEHSASPRFGRTMTRSCQPKRFIGSPFGVDAHKHARAAAATKVVAEACAPPQFESSGTFDDWQKLFDLSAHAALARRASVCSWACPQVHADLHLATAELNGNCTRALPCDLLLSYTSNVSSRRPPAAASGAPLCLGLLNDWFFGERPLLAACAASSSRVARHHAKLAAELDTFGLPLADDATRWLARLVPSPRSCLCMYVRLPDNHNPAQMPFELGKSLRELAAPHAIARRGSRGGRAAPLEVVSNCRPLDACNRALRNASAAAGYTPILRDADELEGALRALRSGLGLRSEENAAVLYDQFRCASCPAIRPSGRAFHARDAAFRGARASGVSSFYQSIVRLHNRLHRNAHVS